VSWDEESVLNAGDTVGYGGTLWILYLAVNSKVGIGRTSDYNSEEGSVRSYAKQELGLEDPGIPPIKEGYRSISRREVIDDDGNRDVINNRDKTAKIIRLTTLGKNPMKVVNSNDDIRVSLKRSIGAEVDQPTKPWWPGEGPQESFPVLIRTFADKSVREAPSVSILTIASFDCDRCGETVEKNYWVKLDGGNIAVSEWSRSVDIRCACDLKYVFSPADPKQPPRPK
jgi:hypothetical protein